MIDRFGLLPAPLKNLIAITELKQKSDALGIVKIEANDKGGKVEFSEKPNIKPEIIIRLIQMKTRQYRLDGPTRLRFTLDKHNPEDRVGLIDKLLNELACRVPE
jgi:transcription-repair coupling factor (superfamily II helicase)